MSTPVDTSVQPRRPARRERPALRRAALWLVIGCFSIAALMGIAVLLAGGSFGDTEARILGTTFAVGVASLAALACFSTLESRFERVGLLGSVLVLPPLVLALILIWHDFTAGPADTWWEWFGSTLTIAVAMAQICLLLAAAGELRRLTTLLWTTVTLAILMALVVILLITGTLSGSGDSWRWIGTLAILDVLGTVVTIALAKFGAGAPRVVRSTTTPPVIERSLLERLDARAAESGRSRDDLLNEAVARYLNS